MRNGNGSFATGNKGGPGGARPGAGRPTAAIRAACGQAFEKRIAVLESIADDPAARAADRIAALGLLARYGLGEKVEQDGAPVVIRVEGEPLAGIGGER
jgi:hypothetical protein